MLPKNRRPTHPGEILRYEFLEPLNLSQQQLADAIGVARVRINEVILGKRSVTPDTAFRLAKFFNTTPEFWIGLQNSIDMWDALHSYKREYKRINPVAKEAALIIGMIAAEFLDVAVIASRIFVGPELFGAFDALPFAIPFFAGELS